MMKNVSLQFRAMLLFLAKDGMQKIKVFSSDFRDKATKKNNGKLGYNKESCFSSNLERRRSYCLSPNWSRKETISFPSVTMISQPQVRRSDLRYLCCILVAFLVVFLAKQRVLVISSKLTLSLASSSFLSFLLSACRARHNFSSFSILPFCVIISLSFCVRYKTKKM